MIKLVQQDLDHHDENQLHSTYNVRQLKDSAPLRNTQLRDSVHLKAIMPKTSKFRITKNRIYNLVNKYIISLLPDCKFIDTITIDNTKQSWPEYNSNFNKLLRGEYSVALINNEKTTKGNCTINTYGEINKTTDYHTFVALQLFLQSDLGTFLLIKEPSRYEFQEKIKELIESLNKENFKEVINTLKSDNQFINFVTKYREDLAEYIKTITIPLYSRIYYGPKTKKFLRPNKIKDILIEAIKKQGEITDIAINKRYYPERFIKTTSLPLIVSTFIRLGQAKMLLNDKNNILSVNPLDNELINRTKIIISKYLLCKYIPLFSTTCIMSPMF